MGECLRVLIACCILIEMKERVGERDALHSNLPAHLLVLDLMVEGILGASRC